MQNIIRCFGYFWNMFVIYCTCWTCLITVTDFFCNSFFFFFAIVHIEWLGQNKKHQMITVKTNQNETKNTF